VLGRNHDMPFLGREMGNEPDYSRRSRARSTDEIRRVIEEAHMTATEVLKTHSDRVHRISLILIERETIDKDQFERLLAGEDEESVFEEKTPAPKTEPRARTEKKRKPEPKTRPFPIPGDHAASAARRRQRLARACTPWGIMAR